jgi:predicted DNA binding CopG/RHH family protein
MAKTEQVNVRVELRDLVRWRKAARRRGLRVTEWIRELATLGAGDIERIVAEQARR